MGIDYGAKRIGIALSDKNGTIAFPKATLPNDKFLYRDLRELLETHRISTVVLGESKRFDGSDNPIMDSIERFKKELEHRFDIDIVYEPEFLSSHQASKENPHNTQLDASAAAIILQSYLDSKNNAE